ncbi:MAG: GGDEF domain-containing protein [Oscillospiraceae bacterium]|nr:GGDEF domain-containing protein [Oscillospiraceae bacterium]
MERSELILRFFTEDVGGILITGKDGEVLYEDGRARLIRLGNTNWDVACPPLREGQRGERWDLLHKDSGQSYMVVSSTMREGEELVQLHHLVDSSDYMELFRDMGSYSKSLKQEKERDGLTGLYNKGKFLSLKQTLFRNQSSLAVFNMDVNNLKYLNDNFGHEAGDKLIQKAAESLRRIEARNVIPFRVGGDEFIVVALHLRREEAEQLRADWEVGLRELNRPDDGIHCVIACGMAYGEEGYDLEELMAEADREMYEDKKAKKKAAGQDPTAR